MVKDESIGRAMTLSERIRALKGRCMAFDATVEDVEAEFDAIAAELERVAREMRAKGCRPGEGHTSGSIGNRLVVGCCDASSWAATLAPEEKRP